MFKLLTPEEAYKAIEPHRAIIGNGAHDVWKSEWAIAQAQRKDTLRQVVEMLDGTENPYRPVLPKVENEPWLNAFNHGVAGSFDEAIQTIKRSLQQALKEEATDEQKG